MTTDVQKQSCTSCARRKVKCDKLSPCSNCSRSQSECIYRAPPSSRRHQKRPADEDLLSRITELEELLRKNNVSFQAMDNSWIPSPSEEKLVSKPQTPRPRCYRPVQTSVAIEQTQELEPSSQISAQVPTSQPPPDLPVVHSEASRLWSGLPKELRDCPIDRFRRPEKDSEDEATQSSTNSSIEAPFSIPFSLNGAPNSSELHPQPKQIFKLWQTFAENVNPSTKVIHAPTLQQRISDVSWNSETITRPLEAVMFGVYASAIISMKAQDCVQTFGETRSSLLDRYRSAAAHALIAAESHITKDSEVLQAFVSFLLLDPRSEVSVTIIALATRIGHKMGLHRTDASAHSPFFEQEMRLRVWWQIMGSEGRARRKVSGLMSSMADYGDVRMPLNINDAELHPLMANRPVVEHSGATEMLYCSMRYEITQYVRLPHTIATIASTNPYESIASTSPEGMVRKTKLSGEMEHIYEDKYLRHCDSSIPSHRISSIVAQSTVHRMRFWCYHPRHQPDGGRHMSQKDQDVVFESSVRMSQLKYDVRETHFSTHSLEHWSVRTEVDAVVYMSSELRHRVSGDLVRTAWSLVERMYDEFPLLSQDDAKFYTSLADSTLKAWEARMHEVETQVHPFPEYISVLQRKRGNVGPVDISATMTGDMVPDGNFDFGSLPDDPSDWISWNEFA